jgi:acetylornithine deacetylase
MPEESVDVWREKVLAEAERLSAGMRAVHSDTGIRIETRMQTPGLSPEPEGIAEPLMRALTGDNSRNAVPFQTEAGQFQEAGLSTVICGPGSIAQAHQPDEYIEIAQLEACTAMMRRLIARLAA